MSLCAFWLIDKPCTNSSSSSGLVVAFIQHLWQLNQSTWLIH